MEEYGIEWYLPASAIQRLMTERPNIRGLGYPSIEGVVVEAERFYVLANLHEGNTSIFARY